MNANEFVKKFGWDYAVKVLNYDISVSSDACHIDFGEHENLKRLVDAWELVGKFGGLEEAKNYVPDLYKSNDLKQAIQLVESCQ